MTKIKRKRNKLSQRRADHQRNVRLHREHQIKMQRYTNEIMNEGLQIMKMNAYKDIWTTEEVPLTDELAKELLEAEEISQEQLDNARAMGYELVWNPKRKSIMSAPQMFGGSNVQEKS